MSHDNVFFALKHPAVPNGVRDALTEVLREGARTLPAQAIEAAVAEFPAGHADQRDPAGRTRLVRNGHLPERAVRTGIGAVTVKAPRVRDRAGQLRFASSILPPHRRRTKTIESTFATVRLRTVKSRGCGSRASILSTVFKLAQSAELRWHELRGAEMLAKVITGVQFRNGVEAPTKDRQKIAAWSKRRTRHSRISRATVVATIPGFTLATGNPTTVRVTQ